MELPGGARAEPRTRLRDRVRGSLQARRLAPLGHRARSVLPVAGVGALVASAELGPTRPPGDAALLAALDDAVARAAARVIPVYEAEHRWARRIRAGLGELLVLFEEDPQLARLCVIDAGAGCPAVLERRGELLERLAAAVDQARASSRGKPPPLAAEAVVGGVMAVIHRALLRGGEPLSALVNPLMAIIVHPYLGGLQAHRELMRPAPSPPCSTDPSANGEPRFSSPVRLTHRTLPALLAIAAEPGLTNVEVARAAGVKDEGQISRLLARLRSVGLIHNTGDGAAIGEPNAWSLTREGEELVRAIRLGLASEQEGRTSPATPGAAVGSPLQAR